jgi:coenzyme F420-0:L-glutamate ligase/coenzyme F420-1:gamma-L-glutamate ligase
MGIEIIGIEGLPIIGEGDDLAALVLETMKSKGNPLRNGDIVVLSHVIVSRAEGRTVDLGSVEPSEIAVRYAEFTGKDPRLVEVVLGDSRAIRRMAPGVLITETRQGFVCANSGVDKSNVPGEEVVALLPEDPDGSARAFRIVCDTHGRGHRNGEVNIAVGASGFNVIRDRRGEHDLFGYELKVKRTAVADELAAAAELAIGQADEGIPVAVVRGYAYEPSESSSALELVRARNMDLFI